MSDIYIKGLYFSDRFYILELREFYLNCVIYYRVAVMKKRCLLLIVLLQAMMVAAQQGWQDSGLLAYTAETGVQQSDDDAKEAFWHEVMEETRSYLDDGNHVLAFEKVGEVLNDSENYTSDPDENVTVP